MYEHNIDLADGTNVIVCSDQIYLVTFADGSTDLISGFWLAKCEIRTPIFLRR
jgi:hypothetical protein